MCDAHSDDVTIGNRNGLQLGIINERNAAQLHLNIVQTRVPWWCQTEYTRSAKILVKYSVRSINQIQQRVVRGNAYSLKVRTVCDIPSPESLTMPVVRHEAQRQNRQDRHVHGGHVERLEHDLRHTLSEGLAVQKRASVNKTRCSSGATLSKVLKNVVPHFHQFVPNRENTVSNGIHQCQDSTLGLRLVQVSRGNRGTTACVSLHRFFRSSEAPSRLMLKRLTMLPSVSHEQSSAAIRSFIMTRGYSDR